MSFASNRYSKKSKKHWTKGNHDSRSRAALATYLNPFVQNSGYTPCIPDGLPTYSLGLSDKHKNLIELNQEMNFILLFPGIMRNILYFSSNADFNSQESLISQLIPDLQYATDILSPWDANRSVVDNAFHWEFMETCRLVSAGLRIETVTNMDYDDGYFEAVRLSPQALLTDGLDTAKFPNNPSYVQGRLQEIDKYKFQLHPIADSNLIPSFQIYDASSNEIMDRDFQYIAPYDPADVDSERARLLDLVELSCDPAWDCILIKIVPNRFSMATPAKILTEVAKNYEFIFDQDHHLSKFSQPPPKDLAGYSRAKTNLTQNNKAAILL